MLGQRVLTALILAPLAVAAILLLPTPWFALLMAAMMLFGLWEWARLAGLGSPVHRAILVVANAALLFALWTQRETAVAWLVIAIGVGWWWLSLVWLRHFAWAAAPTPEHRALKLAIGEAVFVPAWMAVVTLHGSSPLGPRWVLLVIVLVWAADTGAYFAGKRFGTTKLAPRISPNKTTAGLWGGVLLAGTIALAGGWLLGARGLGFFGLAAVALVTVLASVVGDLIESLMKRQAGVKDSGTVFPGHGGLLDRIDSILAAVPVFVAGKALLDFAAAA